MKRKLIKRLLDEIREHIRNGVPHDLVFKPTAGLTQKQKEALQDALNSDFKMWSETWLYPWLDRIEQAAGVDELKN